MNLTYHGKKIFPLLVFLCQQSIGASLKNTNKGEMASTETIVAVAGVSPALLDTAMSLFDNNGKNANWNYFPANLLLGGKDKLFPFPMIEAPKPLKPLLPPAPPSVSKPQPVNQQSVEEKDQSANGPVPLAPLTPFQPVETLNPVEVQSVEVPSSSAIETSPELEVLESIPVSDMDTSYLISEQQSPGSGPESISLEEENYNPPDHHEVEIMGSTPPAQPTTGTDGNHDWSQNSQGGHHTGGNQLLSMNLNANQANFTTSNNVNMHVTSDGGSTSNTHYFGSRVNSKPHHQHHLGQTHNGITNYVIKF